MGKNITPKITRRSEAEIAVDFAGYALTTDINMNKQNNTASTSANFKVYCQKHGVSKIEILGAYFCAECWKEDSAQIEKLRAQINFDA